MNAYKEEVCRKLRETVREFGQAKVTPGILVGPYYFDDNQIGGHQHIQCTTLSNIKLANVGFKIARFFEDI